jgi:F0F1-type ATP synthase assembly protein I
VTLPQRRSETVEVGRYLGLGLTWALSTLLFLYLGSRADAWLHTKPYLTVLGAFLGAGAGFYSMIYNLMVVPRRRKEAAEREGRK